MNYIKYVTNKNKSVTTKIPKANSRRTQMIISDLNYLENTSEEIVGGLFGFPNVGNFAQATANATAFGNNTITITSTFTTTTANSSVSASGSISGTL